MPTTAINYTVISGVIVVRSNFLAIPPLGGGMM